MPIRADGVDVAIVLAVDVSESADFDEVEVQRQGYLPALRDPVLVAAIASMERGMIGLSYFEWSGLPHPESVIAWRLINDCGSADSFAAEIESLPVLASRPRRIGTSISRAIRFGTDQLESATFADRRVIDISGDGRNNIGPSLERARDAALGRGIVINGLPVLLRKLGISRSLPQYCSECVTGGPGSFVMPVVVPEHLALAIRRKLVLELTGAVPDTLPTLAASSPVDCRS